jgi:hypothetical protein
MDLMTNMRYAEKIIIFFDIEPTKVAGSDNFNIFLWRIPSKSELQILQECSKEFSGEIFPNQLPSHVGNQQFHIRSLERKPQRGNILFQLPNISQCNNNNNNNNNYQMSINHIILPSTTSGMEKKSDEKIKTKKKRKKISKIKNYPGNVMPKDIIIGSRSIVNNVRAHPKLPMLASCGIEKVVKIWSPIHFGGDTEKKERKSMG